MSGAWVYMLECSDGSLYVGSTRNDELDKRLGEHQSGVFGGYTAARRPVRLVWAAQFMWITDAIAFERQLKGWRREKKLAVIRGEWEKLHALAGRPVRMG